MPVNVNVVGETSVGVSVSGETPQSVSVASTKSISVAASGGIGPAGSAGFGTLQLEGGDGITVSTSGGVLLISTYPPSAVAGYAPVQSVAGRTGNIVLSAVDVTAGTFNVARIPTISYTALANVPLTFAPAAHTHSTADIIALTASFAGAVHTHSTNEVSGLTATFSQIGHTHSTNEVSELTATFSQVGHTHSTNEVSGLTATFSQIGHTHDASAVASGVLSFDRLPAVVRTLNTLTGTPAIVAGSNVTVSTAGSSITVSAGGTDVSNDLPQPLGIPASGSSSKASRSDHVHEMPNAADVGALDPNSDVDGGEYVGVIVVPSPTISIITQPASKTVTLGSVSETTANLPAGTWGAISLIDGTWYVAGDQATQADYYATSTDGATFVKRFGLPVAGNWRQYHKTSGIIATRAPSGSSSTVAYSTNGLTWSSASLAAGAGSSIFAADGFFLADTNAGISYSTDAATWLSGTSWTYSGAIRFGRAGGYFFAAAFNTGIRASSNASTWGAVRPTTGIGPQNGQTLNAISYGTNVYVSGDSFRPAVFSTTSQTWSQSLIGGTTSGGGMIATDGSVLVFLSFSGTDRIYTSTNGTTWVARPLPSTVPVGNYARLFYAGGKFVLMLLRGITNNVYDTSKPGTAYYTSVNGIDWTAATRAYGTGLNHSWATGDTFANLNASSISIMKFGGATGATTFSAEATFSGGPVAYQWQVSTDGGTTWTSITGATLATYTLTGIGAGDNNKRYRAVVSATGASPVTTNSATLTVN